LLAFGILASGILAVISYLDGMRCASNNLRATVCGAYPTVCE
jgi:hypothetical protein